jgi:hypothetical protein
MVITRVVNQEGIRWENLHYVSDELAALVRRIGHGAKLSVRVNLADLAKVTVVDPHTGELIPAHCTWESYAAKLSLPEHQLLCRSLRARREKIRLSALIGLQRRIAAELAGARQGKKLGEIAQKAERMQQSSESCAQVDDATEALPPTRPPAEIDEMLPASNRSVLDSFLF